MYFGGGVDSIKSFFTDFPMSLEVMSKLLQIGIKFLC